MKVKATEFRKNMFEFLERAANGELTEIDYKGRTLRLVPSAAPSKLSQLPKTNLLNCSLRELEIAQERLSKQIQNAWNKKWKLRR